MRVVQVQNRETPKPDNSLRLVCISDTHCSNLLDLNIPDGDFLIHAGDFSQMGDVHEVADFND
jgi:3',5'-cyclic AMP phosphodiesterase CpdA